MDVRITTRRIDAADPLLRHAEERIRKLVRYNPRLQSAELVLEDEPDGCAAEIRASVPGAPPFIARASAPLARAAFDRAAARLGRQLRRDRSRRTEHQAPPSGAVASE